MLVSSKRKFRVGIVAFLTQTDALVSRVARARQIVKSTWVRNNQKLAWQRNKDFLEEENLRLERLNAENIVLRDILAQALPDLHIDFQTSTPSFIKDMMDELESRKPQEVENTN